MIACRPLDTTSCVLTTSTHSSGIVLSAGAGWGDAGSVTRISHCGRSVGRGVTAHQGGFGSGEASEESQRTAMAEREPADRLWTPKHRPPAEGRTVLQRRRVSFTLARPT